MQTLAYHDHLSKLAAVVYRSGVDDVDRLLATFAADQIRAGHRIGGVVQHEGPAGSNGKPRMQMLDLQSGRSICISQDLGAGAQSCSLDPAGLTEAAVAVARAVTDRVDLVVVNKFSRQEAEGGGLRAEIAAAVVAGLPLLTAVSDKCYDAWLAFTGGFGTTLICERPVIDDWWREMSRRESRRRLLARLDDTLAPAAANAPATAL